MSGSVDVRRLARALRALHALLVRFPRLRGGLAATRLAKFLDHEAKEDDRGSHDGSEEEDGDG